jgi:Flp pilus assembly protein TadD
MLLEADIKARQQKRPEAVELLRQAIKLRPDYSDAYELLGIELALDGHYSEAQTEFEALVRLRPGHSEGHLNLGIALARQHRFREALEQFEATLRLEPQNTQAREFISSIQALQAQSPSP